MELKTKNYKITKTKNYIKNNRFFFLFNGVNRNSNDWLIAEQTIKKLQVKFLKIFNRTSIKTVNNSIFTKISSIISGITFFIKFEYNSPSLSKQVLINKFEPLLFILLCLKLNNKIYSTHQLKTLNSLKYSENSLMLYQFKIANLKLITLNFKDKSK